VSLELHRDGRVLHVLLDRPQKGNALNLELSESQADPPLCRTGNLIEHDNP
jgi:enoyl-CoA hydratase/carnithine racemase